MQQSSSTNSLPVYGPPPPPARIRIIHSRLSIHEFFEILDTLSSYGVISEILEHHNLRPKLDVGSINIPTKKYDGKDNLTCSLCLDEIKKDDEVHKLSCNHIFHAKKCVSDKGIVNWISETQSCPNCRAKIDVSKFIMPEFPTKHNVDEADIETVMTQASVSRETAIKALEKHGNIVDAILDCC